MAASATLALKAGVWFRRGLLLMVSPVRGYHRRYQAETPLIGLFKFASPALITALAAMGLLLFSAQRASDVMLLGPASIKDGWFVFTQQKNRKRKPVDMEIPVRPELLELIAATSTGETTFLVNSLGRPFTRRGFTHWFGKACKAAGVPGRSHGLRKAAASRLAELGASEKEIMSITGHTASKEIKRYTEAADKRKLATAATARHVGNPGTKPTVGTDKPAQ